MTKKKVEEAPVDEMIVTPVVYHMDRDPNDVRFRETPALPSLDDVPKKEKKEDK